jgi:hypothetical protein
MKKFLKYFAIAALIALVIIQFIRPDRNDGGYETVINFEKETKPSVEVAAILKEHCYDCHSHQTRYPWYAEIAPVSYWLADHIEEGNKELNVSEWDSYSVKKKDHKLEEVGEMIEKREMPLDSYTWLHGNLSEAERKLLIQWAALARLQYKEQLKISSK